MTAKELKSLLLDDQHIFVDDTQFLSESVLREQISTNPIWICSAVNTLIDLFESSYAEEERNNDSAYQTMKNFVSYDKFIDVPNNLLTDILTILNQQSIVQYLLRKSFEAHGVESYDWNGKIIVVTGIVDGMTRNDIVDLVSSLGGCVTERVSRTVDAVVIARNPGRNKVSLASSFHIPTWTAEDFIRKIPPKVSILKIQKVLSCHSFMIS